jgi:hypothetical protein
VALLVACAISTVNLYKFHKRLQAVDFKFASLPLKDFFHLLSLCICILLEVELSNFDSKHYAGRRFIGVISGISSVVSFVGM